MSPWVWVGVAVLGGVGACARFAVDGAISTRIRTPFPVGTLVVNASGAFILGVLWGAHLAPDALLLAGTATIGSYTTFSTWMLETQRLAEDGLLRSATVNLLLSLALGLAFAALGHWLGGL